MTQRAIVSSIVAAIGKARGFMDQDILIICGGHTGTISVVHRVEQAPDGVRIYARFRQFLLQLLRPIERRVPASYLALQDGADNGRVLREHLSRFLAAVSTQDGDATPRMIQKWPAEQHAAQII